MLVLFVGEPGSSSFRESLVREGMKEVGGEKEGQGGVRGYQVNPSSKTQDLALTLTKQQVKTTKISSRDHSNKISVEPATVFYVQDEALGT